MERPAYRPQVEIVEDVAYNIAVGDLTLCVSPTTEFIQRFAEHRFDYLHYLDNEHGCLTMVFLGQVALNDIAGLGIPQSKERLKITKEEYRAWLDWQTEYNMYGFEREVTDIQMPE